MAMPRLRAEQLDVSAFFRGKNNIDRFFSDNFSIFLSLSAILSINCNGILCLECLDRMNRWIIAANANVFREIGWMIERWWVDEKCLMWKIKCFLHLFGQLRMRLGWKAKEINRNCLFGRRTSSGCKWGEYDDDVTKNERGIKLSNWMWF